MFALAALPVDASAFDVVPSAVQVVLVPLCEGIAAGLAMGALALAVIRLVEYLLAEPNALPTDAPSSAAQATGVRSPRPAVGARTLPARRRTPTHPRPNLLPRVA